MQDTKPRNITRTWKLDLYGSYGEGRSASVYLGTRTVTLSADNDGNKTAQVDDLPATLGEVVRLMEWAKAEGRVTLVSEERTAPPIGKARACRLHRLLSLVGIPAREHYGFVSAALDQNVYSLAALTEDEARAVWNFMVFTCPAARLVAA